MFENIVYNMFLNIFFKCIKIFFLIFNINISKLFKNNNLIVFVKTLNKNPSFNLGPAVWVRSVSLLDYRHSLRCEFLSKRLESNRKYKFYSDFQRLFLWCYRGQIMTRKPFFILSLGTKQYLFFFFFSI